MIIYDLPPPILSAIPRPHSLLLQAATAQGETCTRTPTHRSITVTHTHTLSLSHFSCFPVKSNISQAQFAIMSFALSHTTEVATQLAQLSPCSMLSSEKQRYHPIRCFGNQMLHFSRSRLRIKWHMADESLWYLSHSLHASCFFVVPNFQQLDPINPGKPRELK